MERVNVDSSHIRAIGYDSDNAILEIEFKDGAVYEYYEVPQYVYDEFITADSHGKYAHKNIYKVYRYERIA
jgi:hypothetical protein